ncbi:hypothetical protein [Paenibacillus flagellatus]|uniref:Uncharacterized protein n=1 Tax=Paenibacillus flagellatus TaxID=2211139 RepID=A0A2V5KKL3_9BACL|nr:hypothetical protein [Paenibacillus flagellatus]PYI51137.1 hypothetical protein DLM86_25950 [Paenibacillus flagellatus]
MAKLSKSGAFHFTTSGTKALFVVPKGVDGTIAISNNSNKAFVLLLNGAITISVKPYTIARIGTLSGGFSTRVAIRTRGAVNGAFIFQQT